MPLDTSASFGDILTGKLLVVLDFRLATTPIVREILGGFSGIEPLVVLYMFLGDLLGLSLGLRFGSLFNSVQSASTVSGLVLLHIWVAEPSLAH